MLPSSQYKNPIAVQTPETNLKLGEGHIAYGLVDRCTSVVHVMFLPA